MKIVGSIAIGTGFGSAWGLDLDEAGDYAYVGDYSNNRLRVIDIRDRSDPGEVGSVTHKKLAGAAYPLYHNGYVYVEGRKVDGRFCVVDVTDPSAPQVVGTTDTCCITQRKRMLSDNMVIGCRGSTVRIMDVSNPEKPADIGSVSDSTRLDSVVGIALKAGDAYVSGYHRFSTIDIPEPWSPGIIATLTDYEHISGDTRDVEIAGNYALIADFENGSMGIIDISDVSAPKFLRSLKDTQLKGLWDIEISSTKAYCAADLANTFSIVDISNINAPSIVDSIKDDTALDGVMDIKIRGEYAFVTAIDTGRLTVIDLTGEGKATAYITISSSPLGANVSIDGIFKGTT